MKGRKRVFGNKETVNSKGDIVKREIILMSYESEPDYIKKYTEHNINLCNMKGRKMAIMDMLTKYINYDNEIILSNEIKKIIAKDMGIALNSLEHGIGDLLKDESRVMLKICNNHYIVNPMYFAKGSFRDIKKINDKFKAMLGIDTSKELSPNDNFNNEKGDGSENV